MARTPKKQFFSEPTKAQIKRMELRCIDSDLIRRIDELEPNQGLIIERRLIPKKYKNPKKFLKYGNPLETFLMNENGETIHNSQIRERTFDLITNRAYPGYLFTPSDITELTESLEAAGVYYYSFHAFPKQSKNLSLIDITPYGNLITVKVRSRRKNVPAYDFNYHLLKERIKTEGHLCKFKQFSFKTKDLYKNFWCCHEIAAFWRMIELGILDPEINSFAVPTQQEVSFYKKLKRILIRDEELKNKDKLRKLHKEDEETLLWGSVYIHKYNKKFNGKIEELKNYNWS